MAIKRNLLLVLFGILIGLIISPWAQKDITKKMFVSPVDYSRAAYAEEVVVPEEGAKVLGVKEKDVAEERRAAMNALLMQQNADMEIEVQKTVVTKNMTIALFGDSMVDTMGTGTPSLNKALKEYYPDTNFNLLNYGIGAETIRSGQERFNLPYDYKDRNYPPLLESGAQIIIIKSFAYNPEGESGLETQHLVLEQMVGQAKAKGKKVLLLATLAPLRTQFCQGTKEICIPADQAIGHATLIGRYLENTVDIGRNLGLPVIDAYHASINQSGEGNSLYVNQADHIHPSAAGHAFVASLIARKISDLGLVR